jgi:adenosine deaminase
LTPADLSEISRNSVLQSCFEDIVKEGWLGKGYDGKEEDFTINNSKFIGNF